MPDQLEFDYDVFISYSSHDKDWVRGILLKKIEKSGLCAFIDFRDFERGAPCIREMERGVVKCRKTLLVLTPDYINSEWCEIESVMAQTQSPANRDLRLIPVLKRECNKPLSIGALVHIDFTEGADSNLAWQQLLNALDAQFAKPTEEAMPEHIQEELDKAKNLTDADKYFDAIPILEKTLIAADVTGHAVARVKTRCRLANALAEGREDFKTAMKHYQDALAMVPISDLDLKHSVLHGLGDMLFFSGRLDEAKATIRAGIDIAKTSGKKDDLAFSLLSLGLLERALGLHDSSVSNLDEALHLLLQQALSLRDDAKKDNAHTLAVCYINKALLCQDAGDLDAALALYKKVEEQHRISGDKLNVAKALVFCGEVHCANADWENAFDCFRRAHQSSSEANNPLWCARSLEHMSRLFATHERWEESFRAIYGAVAGAEESGRFGEQVHFLRLAAKILREWKTKISRQDISSQIHKYAKEIPEEKQAEIMSSLSAEMGEIHDAIAKSVREDEQVRDLLNKAKEIARKEHLHERLANCLLDEAHEMTLSDDRDAQHDLITEAIGLLKEELREVQFPKRRGHLMGRISALYRDLDERPEALSWLKKAVEVFEKSGDVFGLAEYHGALAEIHRKEGRLEDEIAAYRRVLELIEGRSFHRHAAGARINLAVALRRCREFGEAQLLLNEAEAICDQHHFKDFVSIIARNRTDIESELQASQAPSRSLSQLLDSFHQLIEYRPDYAAAYLPFWYSAWKTELLALLRSGPSLSFMVVTDDVDRFMKFSVRFTHLAGHFMMATTREPTVKVEAKVLPIPPSWLFPARYPFFLAKRAAPDSESTKEKVCREKQEDAPPSISLDGPARMLPLYMPIDVKSDVEDEGHMLPLSDSYLPEEAIDLMIRRPTKELIERRAVWLPYDRFDFDDPLLADLESGQERGVFPVYLDRLPTSDVVADFGGVQVAIPNKLLSGDLPSMAAKWERALLKLTKLPKDEAQVALLDIPEVLSDPEGDCSKSTQIEIRLFAFSKIGKRVLHPVILVRE